MKVIRRDPAKGYLDTLFWVPKAFCNVDGVKSALSFQFFNKKSVQILTLWRETQHHILVPREFWDTASPELTFPIVDCRPPSYEKVDIRSRIKLDHRFDDGKLVPTGDTVQREAFAAILQNRGGILQLACGKGKTVVALALSAHLGIPTLIVVDTTQLVGQWREEIDLFLEVPGGIGMIGDGEFDWHKPIVIATYHTLGNRAASFPEEARRWFGLIIWDEAHHVAAPTFARSADLFSGRRLGLTATPTRADGLHVVYNAHIGKVLYKNLTQDLKPEIFFRWTGITLDPNDVLAHVATHDKNSDLHLGKLASYFARLIPRLDFILNEVHAAASQGRKILVLSKSVDETINLLARWNGRTSLYTDIPYPTQQEVGETVPPLELEKRDEERLRETIIRTAAQLKDPSLNPVKRSTLQDKIRNIEFRLQQHVVWKKCEALFRKRQREYLKALLDQPSNAGLMIADVKAEVRMELLRSKQITFAIMKYGREGLNEKSLDTVIAAEPISDPGALQQLIGRVLREKKGKRNPIAVFIEDNIGILIGMCTQLRKHLLEWSIEDGGPYDYTMVGHPATRNKRNPWST